MHFTPVLALAGLAAAAPYNLHIPAGNSTAPAGLKYRSTISNSTVPTGLKYRRSSHFPNATAPDPASYENIDISDLSVQEKLVGNTAAVESITSVSFIINGNITCQASNPGTTGTVNDCGSTPYSFGLANGTETQFALYIYHALGNFAGRWGKGDVATYCHDGGSSDLGSYEICDQVNPTTIVIQ